MRLAKILTLVLGISVLSGCGAANLSLTAPDSQTHHSLKIVTTTPILADLVRNVAMPGTHISSLVPNGASPHTYEPSLRDVRKIVYADAVFSNHLLLEEQSLIRTVNANLPKNVPNTAVAELSSKYGASLIRLVEDPSLNTIWLGMRVKSDGKTYLATRDSQVRIQAVEVSGSGVLSAFLTGTFGQAEPYFSSEDGFSAFTGYRGDTVTLPTNAHTHMSWGFSKPGIYRLKLRSQLANQATAPMQSSAPKCEKGKNLALCALGQTEVVFAVGVDPYKVSGRPGAKVLNSGHLDISVDLENGKFVLHGDRQDKKVGTTDYSPDDVVIEVPNAALKTIPADASYRFLGRPGTQAYILAQAVLGKHVHGEIDPHFWQSVPNVKAAVQVIRDRMIEVDPAHRENYYARSRAYLKKLDQLDKYIRDSLASLPEEQRNLVTTHDAFGYLAKEYGLNVAGYVSSNPSMEPSSADMVKLTRTLKALQVKAVFVEPTMLTHVNDLKQAAKSVNVKVCAIYGDTFYRRVDSYLKLMAANAYQLKTCLDPLNAPPPPFKLEHDSLATAN